MRSSSDIQRAHDVLAQVLSGGTPVQLDMDSQILMTECCSVLCWALGHDHDQGNDDVSFGVELERLEDELRAYGGVLINTGHPQVGRN